MRVLTWLLPVVLVTAVTTAHAQSSNEKACTAAFESGQLERRAKHYGAARDHFDHCLRVCPAHLLSHCRQWIDELRRLQPSIVLRAKAADGTPLQQAMIWIDGKRTGKLFGQRIVLDPGKHTVRIEHAGHEPVERQIDLADGQTRDIDIQLVAHAPEAIPAKSVGNNTLPIILGITGGALLATAAALSLAGHLERSSLENACAPRCSPEQAAPVDRMWIAGGALAGIGAATVVTAVLLGLRKPEEEATPRALLIVGPHAVHLRVSF